MAPQSFISGGGLAARTSIQTTKVPASFIVADAALESGWGVHAPGFSLFEIKADASWKRPVTVQRARIPEWGADARRGALSGLRRLARLDRGARTLLGHELALRAGNRVDERHYLRPGGAAADYATHPNYAAKIIAIIKSHGLTSLDIARGTEA